MEEIVTFKKIASDGRTSMKVWITIEAKALGLRPGDFVKVTLSPVKQTDANASETAIEGVE